MTKENHQKITEWIRRELQPAKTIPWYAYSYRLKHYIEYEDGTYVTEEEFKEAMEECGYETAKKGRTDTYYRCKFTKHRPYGEYPRGSQRKS
jgi:hypothetical protein